MKVYLVLPIVLGLSGCAHLFVKDRTYEGGGTVTINGAEVRSAVKPMGGKQGISVSAMVYNAASGETDGPFLWRIEAVGEEGVHESLTVHQLRVKTAVTKRNERYPSKWLGEEKRFVAMKGKENEGKVFASYQIPGKLEVFPEQDGAITIEAVVSVKARGRSERQVARFAMSPKTGRETDFVFLPAELVTSFGGEDPTEWKWTPARQSEFETDPYYGNGFY